jgi:16S rRNA (cytosine967-C5)-methyltransferase
VKKGGILVYSTCTVDKEENENTVAAFLKENPQFEEDSMFKERMPTAIRPLISGHDLQIFPQDFGSDGFYIAVIRKKV